jgi:MFS family permease
MKGLGGTLAIVATYVFFLIYAQFAFLELGKAATSDPDVLNYLLLPMGLGGAVVSLILAFRLQNFSNKKLLQIGFLGCGVTALLSVLSTNLIFLSTLSLFIGIFLALVTVTLAAGLRELLPTKNFGLQVGLGTGLAYFICNVPFVFESNPQTQAIIAGAFCFLGAYLFREKTFKTDCVPEDFSFSALRREDFFSYGFYLILISFLALVWLDSSAFYVIQQTTGLKTATWGSSHLWTNAFFHLFFAALTGILLDRNFFKSLLFLAFIFLATGVLSLNDSYLANHFSALFYVSGVSIYSTLLVAFPSLYREEHGISSRRFRAGLVYAVAGWIGSAMGIGMAQDLKAVPLWFIAFSGTLIFSSLFFSKIQKKNLSVASLIILGFVFLGEKQSFAEGADKSAQEQGREVYIQEGCIHCHSQYVRPGTDDVVKWGPVKKTEQIFKETPPLIGNRRQGPDLTNVGNRRNYEWLKLHFQSPRSLVPGSVMPDYPHLFKDARGEALLQYLLSLGADTFSERIKIINNWKPKSGTVPATTARAIELYSNLCASCHGLNGNGAGVLAKKINAKVAVLNSGKLIRVNLNSPEAILELSRVIKFGIVGTTMPGHEYLSDQDVLGLAHYLNSFAKK